MKSACVALFLVVAICGVSCAFAQNDKCRSNCTASTNAPIYSVIQFKRVGGLGSTNCVYRITTTTDLQKPSSGGK